MFENNIRNNIKRFSGFSECYDKNRPQAPEIIVEILKMYLGKNPDLVVDIGCGTGLSTFVWKDSAEKTVGVEPNEDMINKAKKKKSDLKIENIDFLQAVSTQIPLDQGCAEIVTCSQSFHWMEPESTIREVVRILTTGGVFAVYDCIWPPSINYELEKYFKELIKSAYELFDSLKIDESNIKKWDEDKHLENIQKSGFFKFTKEIFFHNKEKCDSERFAGLALSQGFIQTVIKFSGEKIKPLIEDFKNNIEKIFNDRELEMIFSYKMRIGIK